MLVQNENAKLRAALLSNLKSAVTASFLMLPESFSEEDLFLQIAGLSYAGNSCCITDCLLFNIGEIFKIKLYINKPRSTIKLNDIHIFSLVF